MLMDSELSIKELAKTFLWRIFSIHKDGARHYEDGIYVRPKGFLYNKLIVKKKISYIIGCNFSCWREDIEHINGFNEDFVHPSVGEDVDIDWRFRASGVEVISCRNIANVYHLYHKKSFGAKEGFINNKILKKNLDNNQYVCLNGIKKYDEK
jgi:GT2 family glycosyltransferase